MSVIDRAEAIYTGMSRLRQFARYSIGRFLGTIPATKGAYLFILELAESRHIHRVELSAIVDLMVKKRVCTSDEWTAALDREIGLYEKDLGQQWPECKPSEDGASYALDMEGFRKRVAEERWPR